MRFTQILLKARWEKEIGAVGEMTEKYSNLPKSYIKRTMRQVFHMVDFMFCFCFYKKSNVWFIFYRSNMKRQEIIHDTYRKQLKEKTSDSLCTDHGLNNFGSIIIQENKLKKHLLNQLVRYN